MHVANLSNALVSLTVVETATGRPHEVFIQPYGRPRLCAAHNVPPAVQAAYRGVLVFEEDATPETQTPVAETAQAKTED